MQIDQFVTFLASAGGASAAMAFLFERIPAFQALTGERKSLVVLAGSLVIALAAWAVLTFVPPATLAQIAPVFQIVYGVVGTWIASQFSHAADPSAK